MPAAADDRAWLDAGLAERAGEVLARLGAGEPSGWREAIELLEALAEAGVTDAHDNRAAG